VNFLCINILIKVENHTLRYFVNGKFLFGPFEERKRKKLQSIMLALKKWGNGKTFTTKKIYIFKRALITS